MTARAQADIRGVLVDDSTGAAVRGTVMLVDPATNGPVVHVTTDAKGAFDLKTGYGTYQIAAVTAGYTSVLSAPVSLENGERMTIRIPIATNGDPQHNISVLEHVRPDPNAVKAAQSLRDASTMGGFNRRMILGTGLHYTRAQLLQSQLTTLGEFLQGVPGLMVSNPGSTASMNLTRNMGSPLSNGMPGNLNGPCRLGWFVDGHRVDIPGRADPLTDGLGSLPLDGIMGVEVFRGLSEMPPEFAEPDLRCGAIAIWTQK
ncbi:MAG TPA: carboxypeptidase regulatory-like domain-containing protein [Gemmatimonadaceae bacterium]|nr:carboxypeptidase regulatory-like domain-containing protein [Gemmatimonadaceae bacterium]